MPYVGAYILAPGVSHLCTNLCACTFAKKHFKGGNAFNFRAKRQKHFLRMSVLNGCCCCCELFSFYVRSGEKESLAK